MRTYYTTSEVRQKLGGISQPRVSQLVHEGMLVADYDPDGRLRYDRESVDAYARNRAATKAYKAGEKEERRALNAEQQARFARQRQREREAQAARQANEDELKTRAVVALETIAKYFKDVR